MAETAQKKRKALTAKTRFEIFKRDGFLCMYCGAHPPDVILHVDHIVPVFEGGSNELENLITSCERCNLGKGKNSLSSVPVSLAEKAKEIAEREKQLAGYQEVMEARFQRLEDEQWRVAEMFMGHFSDDAIRKDWLRSIKTFVERIGVHECLGAMEIALGRFPWSQNKAFKYFCGVCWNRIRG